MMRYFLALIGGALAAIALCLPGAATGAELSLIKDQRSPYEILIPDPAPESVREAAQELQRLLKRATGVQLPIAKKAKGSGRYISIGATPLTAHLKIDSMAHDAFIMQVRAKNLLLVGRDEDVGNAKAHNREVDANSPLQFYNLRRWNRSLSAGSYNATIEFARRFLQARWYMPGPLGEEIANIQHLQVPATLDKHHAPHFAMRRFNFTDYDEKSLRAAKAGKETEIDLEVVEQSTRWGRRLRHSNNIVLGNGHGWRQWIPADQYSAPWIAESIDLPLYGATHPEFFALVNGKRQSTYTSKAQHGGQLCVANPQLIETYADNIIAFAKKNPQTRMFSLAQNDGGQHCECDLCRAWDPPGSGPGAGDVESPFLTDRMLRFQNAVIKRVVAEVPDAQFTAAAYHSTGRAPLEQIADPRLHIIGFYNYLPYRLHIGEKRRELAEAMRGWARATDNFYFASFYFAYGNYSLPWSSTATMRWMIDMMVANKHRGLSMYFGVGGTRPLVGQLGPDMWLASQLLWDPTQSADALIDEWYLGSFGPEASPLIRAYFDAIDQAMETETARFPNFWGGRGFTQRQINLNVYPSIRERCAELIAQAERAVANDAERYRWRVEQIARNWHYTELTIDAIEALRQSRIVGTDAAIDKALNLGRAREAYIEDRANRYAISHESIRLSERTTPLDILRELPGGALPTLRVPTRGADAPVIDGNPSESAWSDAATIANFRHNKTMETSSIATNVRVVSTDAGLFVRALCDEPFMDQLKVAGEGEEVWQGDVFEVFLAPSGGDGSYYQFLVNAHGMAAALAYRGDTGRDLAWQPQWQRAGFKQDGGWGAEIFIPWETLDVQRAPAAGEQWRAAFYRERYTQEHGNSAWSPTGGLFAQPHLFGKLVFANN